MDDFIRPSIYRRLPEGHSPVGYLRKAKQTCIISFTSKPSRGLLLTYILQNYLIDLFEGNMLLKKS